MVAPDGVPCRRWRFLDLTDEQWEVLMPLLPDPPRRADGKGRPWRDPRNVLNGILWVLRTGAPWRDYLSATRPTRDLPPALPAVGGGGRALASPRGPAEDL